MVKVQAIVQARMGSERLPGKVLRPILGKPMLFFLLERLKRSALLSTIVVATTTEAKDDPIEALCNDLKVRCVRGDPLNVLLRFIQALDEDASHVVRITADCPLIDPKIVDRVIEEGLNFDYASSAMERTYPRGFDVELMTRKALIAADRESTTPYEREHVTPFIYSHPERFSFKSIEREGNASLYRVTVDTQEDYELVKKIFEELYPLSREFSAEDVIAWLKKHPEWVQSNAHIKQKGHDSSASF